MQPARFFFLSVLFVSCLCSCYTRPVAQKEAESPVCVRELEKDSLAGLTPYDSLFQKHARSLGWDWRLLASIAWQESRFGNAERSRAGARGLMGVMPGTAKALKIPPEQLTDPDVCIGAGTEVLRIFSRGFRGVADTTELIKLTLAAYNAGIGHVYDARRLAVKHGKNPAVWDGNVAEFILLKRKPEFYNDSVCRHGYLRGRETFNYVKEILACYERYKEQ